MDEWDLPFSVYYGQLYHHPVTLAWSFVLAGTPGGQGVSRECKIVPLAHQFCRKEVGDFLQKPKFA